MPESSLGEYRFFNTMRTSETLLCLNSWLFSAAGNTVSFLRSCTVFCGVALYLCWDLSCPLCQELWQMSTILSNPARSNYISFLTYYFGWEYFLLLTIVKSALGNSLYTFLRTFLLFKSRTLAAALLNVEHPPWGHSTSRHCIEIPTCSVPSAQSTTCKNVCHTSIRLVSFHAFLMWYQYIFYKCMCLVSYYLD